MFSFSAIYINDVLCCLFYFYHSNTTVKMRAFKLFSSRYSADDAVFDRKENSKLVSPSEFDIYLTPKDYASTKSLPTRPMLSTLRKKSPLKNRRAASIEYKLGNKQPSIYDTLPSSSGGEFHWTSDPPQRKFGTKKRKTSQFSFDSSLRHRSLTSVFYKRFVALPCDCCMN